MLRFQVPAMSCGHCVKVITDTVLAVDPRARVDADLATHGVTVESDLPREAFVAPLADAGYPPVELPEAA